MMIPKFKTGNAKNFLFPATAAVSFIIAAVFFYSAFNGRNDETPLADSIIPDIVSQNRDFGFSASTTESVSAATSTTPAAVPPVANYGVVKNPAAVIASPSAPVTNNAAPVISAPKENMAVRDGQRQADMRRLAGAQNLWHGDHKRYYTCSTVGGDCRGKINNLPVSIGSAARNVADPLNSGRVCGRDYTYCGLDNTKNAAEFCYYAKLEAGGYYGVSRKGTFKVAVPPLNLVECSAAALVAAPKTEEPQRTTPQERDLKRQSDMFQLSIAQLNWFSQRDRYYICGSAGGDCPQSIGSYPLTLGFAMLKTPVDPLNSGMACGRDQIYCGLDNSQMPAKFCYFAKLETGGYYTASNSGNFKRSTAPATFGECNQPN